MKLIQCILGLGLLCLPCSAFAYKQYRCSGRVQYRPCDIQVKAPPRIRPLRQVSGIRVQKKPDTDRGELYAKVVKHSFARSSMIYGVWSGRVEGNGDIHLHLLIMRNGQVENQRYMGHVALANKSTIFKFKSPLPQGDDWSWKILANPI